MENMTALFHDVTYAEKYVIGSIIVDDTCIDVAMEMLKPQDFVGELERIIFSAMCVLRNAGKPINIASVLTVVSDDPLFIKNNGVYYLSTCSNDVPSASTIEHFCSIVRDDSLRRKLVSLATEVQSKNWSAAENVETEISKFGNEVLDLITDTNTTPWVDFKTALKSTYEELMNDDGGSRVMTGFVDLDAKMCGLRPGSLTIIAARPGMGKTALALNLIRHVAFQQNIPTAFFTLEMTTLEIMFRIISAETSINGNAIRERKLSDPEWERLLSVAEQYRDKKLFIDDTPALDIGILRERARRLHRQHNVGFLVADYVQLMRSTNSKNYNREQEVANISRGLKAVAKELKIPVVALAQLNRSLEARADKRPLLSDLRESGSIEQDADNVLFIHRDDYYKREEALDNVAEVIIAKQRSGAPGVIKLRFTGEFTRFDSLETIYA